MGLRWRASSRGLALERGVNKVGPMAVEAITLLEALGVRAADAATRPPAQLTTDDLERADRVVALKQDEHLPCFKNGSRPGPIRSSSGRRRTPRRRCV
jgi:protein-tyrosine phosphatase